ncbi:MAG: glycosyltransferase family 4 protein [Anaerolineae bacterium]|nr:glycosyltransferase family 4 protein [Anaerolineae bacterium]
MRFGLDGRYIRDHFPGIGRYTYHLACAVADAAPDDTLVVLLNERQENSRHALADLTGRPNVEVALVAAPPFSLREYLDLPLAARRYRLDLLHSPYYVKPYWLPVPSVTTVYDVTPARYPEALPSRRARFVFELTTRLAIETSAALLTLSESARRDMRELFDARPDRITVTYPAVDATFTPRPADEVARVRETLGLPEAYILYLGINKPHKNLVRLVEAFARVAAALPEVTLALAGKPDPRYPDAVDRARALGLGDRVRVLGAIAEDSLPALYTGAALFVFPSLYEGFGFPVLEAMACGAPVITSSASSLPEVAGEAALLVNPVDTDVLARAMLAVLQDGRLWTRLHRASLARAAEFSWTRAAQQTLTMYRRVARTAP